MFFFNQIYCLQNDGRSKTSIANNSSLPKIIPMLKTHFEKFGKFEKFPFGPIISPSPGPTFEIAVAAPDIEVVKSKPSRDNRTEIEKKINIYKNKKEIIDDINFSEILFLSYFIMNIPRG